MDFNSQIIRKSMNGEVVSNKETSPHEKRLNKHAIYLVPFNLKGGMQM